MSMSALLGAFLFVLIFVPLPQVTLVTSQPGRSIVHQLEMGLKDADLVSLKRLLVVQIYSTGDWGQDALSPEAAAPSETEGRKYKYTHKTQDWSMHTHSDSHKLRL